MSAGCVSVRLFANKKLYRLDIELSLSLPSDVMGIIQVFLLHNYCGIDKYSAGCVWEDC